MRKRRGDQFAFTAGLKAMLRETESESDRATALTVGAVVDAQVHAIVRKGLKGSSRLLDGPGAPLGTAYARNALLYEAGVISVAFYADLELIRKIRNEFAHNWDVSAFTHPRVANLVDTLLPNDDHAHGRSAALRSRLNFQFAQPLLPSTNLPHRARFGLAVVVILVYLSTLRKGAKKPKKPKREAIYGALGKLGAAQLFMDASEMDDAGVPLVIRRNS